MTDFGLQDSYVGQLKGVIAAINPQAIVVDLCHAIPPQDLQSAALLLADSIDAFSPGSIHVAVVDPGVGSTRRAIAAEIGGHRFVCPDNGILTLVEQKAKLERYVELDQPRWWRTTVSRTFHGRDVFAPVAAAWSNGRDLTELGSIGSGPLVQLDLARPMLQQDGAGRGELTGTVVAIDHFGNLITNVVSSYIPAGTVEIQIQIADRFVSGIDECYANQPPGELIALMGSSSRLEVAVVNGSAAAELNVKLGQTITIHWKDKSP